MNDRTLNHTDRYWIDTKKSKETQAMNNTIPNLTIIYYSEKTEKINRIDDDKQNWQWQTQPLT